MGPKACKNPGKARAENSAAAAPVCLPLKSIITQLSFVQQYFQQMSNKGSHCHRKGKRELQEHNIIQNNQVPL